MGELGKYWFGGFTFVSFHMLHRSSGNVYVQGRVGEGKD